MIYADYVVIGIVAISILVGAIRGFIKEVFSLAVWAAAFVVAFTYSGAIAVRMENLVELPSARTSLAFIALFLVVLLVGGLITFLVGMLVEKTGLSGTDRLLGGVFGSVRGLAIVVAIMLTAGLTPIPRDYWWQESRMVQSLLPLAEWSAQFLPDYIRDHMELRPEEPEAGEANA